VKSEPVNQGRTDNIMTRRKKDRQHKGQMKKDKRTDNTMAKRKRTKGQTTIYITVHIKLKIE
jgi:hypothetical protein